jgi:hypothetical protein
MAAFCGEHVVMVGGRWIIYPMAGCGIGVELSDFTTRELLSLVNFILEQIHSENNYIISTTIFILL